MILFSFDIAFVNISIALNCVIPIPTNAYTVETADDKQDLSISNEDQQQLRILTSPLVNSLETDDGIKVNSQLL